MDFDLMNKFSIPHNVVCRWALSVKKNYRPVKYHNWRHALNVCQTMFTVLKTGKMERFMEDMEVFGLLVACLCHDLDHRGTNNSYQTKVSKIILKKIFLILSFFLNLRLILHWLSFTPRPQWSTTILTSVSWSYLVRAITSSRVFQQRSIAMSWRWWSKPSSLPTLQVTLRRGRGSFQQQMMEKLIGRYAEHSKIVYSIVQNCCYKSIMFVATPNKAPGLNSHQR